MTSHNSGGLYYETIAIKTLGLIPHPKLYQRLADLRENMGRIDEARAWHRLVLRDSPGDALSLAALRGSSNMKRAGGKHSCTSPWLL